ncbi:MAG TPA: DEAD/DEAH box helicase [Candidatus Poseidoniales archaeon]|jgi:Fanconi anemia group M protein|nr:DEAD/DEAH box helicase [Candidatus Poseidoniales archaeon]
MPPSLGHPNLREGVEARAYQLLAAKQALSGSTLLVMPTGLGKTAVQWMAMAEAIGGAGKVVLVAPTTGLVAQQARMAREMIAIPEEKIIILTGDVRPAKREQLWVDAKIVMATPHVIRNDAQNGRILLGDIDLLIVDEAHHATGSDSMAQLGDMYLESNSNALVLAATASPGVKDERVIEIVQRLGIERLHVARKEDDLLAPYVTAMEVESHRLALPENLLDLIRPLRMCESEESEFLRRGGFLIRTGRITTAAIDEAQRRASAAIGRGDPRGYDAAKRIGDLRRLHRLLDLIETQGLNTAIQYLDRARGDNARKTKRFLSLTEVSNFHRICGQMQEIHPKPQLVSSLTSTQLKIGGKVIIFTEYRDTVDYLISILSQLDGVKAGRFVGQSSKSGNIGMKQKEQLQQLDRFRSGEINVLVATSVGEEGLDVPAADCVILYEPVPSAIRAIQRRGRTARQSKGDVHILISKNTRDEYVQMASIKREQAMYRTLERLKRQSRLPRRAPPTNEILSLFTVDGQTAESFIKSEQERLYRPPEIKVVEPKQQKSKPKSPELINRPRAQKSLAEFANSSPEPAKTVEPKWWEPVLDGTSSPSREEESATAAAAITETDHLGIEHQSLELIAIDNRESASTLPSLLKLMGHEVSMEHLPVGDIRISERILIERKSARDLVDSLLDGRLVHQAKRLMSAAARPLMIIESNETDRVHPNAVQGAMAWLTLDLGIPVLMTGSTEGTARFVSIAAKREARMLDLLVGHSKRKPPDPILESLRAASQEVLSIINGEAIEGALSKRWTLEVLKQRSRILAELPGIGLVTAQRVMEKAGDIDGLCQLTEKELSEVDGVSSIQARDLYRFLHG